MSADGERRGPAENPTLGQAACRPTTAFSRRCAEPRCARNCAPRLKPQPFGAVLQVLGQKTLFGKALD